MKFTIRGKEEELRFGMKFIRELDKTYQVDYQGLKFGMGVNLGFMGLNQFNPTTLADIMQASLAHDKNAPKLYQIEEAIEDYADEHDGLKSLFHEVLDEMGKSKVVKDSIEQFDELAKVETEEEEN